MSSNSGSEHILNNRVLVSHCATWHYVVWHVEVLTIEALGCCYSHLIFFSIYHHRINDIWGYFCVLILKWFFFFDDTLSHV